jgi:hypothetical protein
MTETTTRKEKSVGHIHSIMLKLREPPMNVENMEINKLNIMIGANGAGKSFVLVTSWVFAYISSTIVLSGINGPMLNDMVQFTVSNCYDIKDLTGEMGVVFESGAEIYIKLNEGKVETVNYSGFEGVTIPTGVSYMSSAMRTFEAISMYLKFRKMANNNIEELLKTFKLYDVMQIESMIVRMPLKPSPQLLESLQALAMPHEFTEFGVDLDHCDFYGIDNGKKRWLSSFSKGEQAILNMTISQLLQHA